MAPAMFYASWSKMFDANAKIPSGILRGNVNQFGDFDECLEVSSAKYCLIEVDLSNLWRKLEENEIENLVHSQYIIKATYDDPKHRVPNYSMIKWGVCIPKLCNISGISKVVSEKLDLKIRAEEDFCQSGDNDGSISKNTMISFGALIFLTGLASAFKLIGVGHCSKLLGCFEIQSNWIKFNDAKKDRNESLDGIRALSALALLMSHKAMVQLFGPYVDGYKVAEHFGQSWSILGRTAVLHTDTFILLSGFLTAKSMVRNYAANQTLGFRRMCVDRMFRILPSLIVTIIFCTEILPNLSSGPYKPMLVGHHANLCRKFWWRNVLFINNLYPFEEMCLTHTHQIAIDMQLFVVSPIIVYFLLKRRIFGYILGFSIILASSILKYLTIAERELSYIVYFGTSVSQLFDTANYSYIRATHRVGIYAMGIFAAFTIRDFNKFTVFMKRNPSLYVIFGMGSGLWVMLRHHRMGLSAYAYDAKEAADFGAIGSFLWACSVSWTIHASENDYGGWFPKLLSWKHFAHFTKISYAFYLVQFPLLFHSVASTKHPIPFDSNFLELGETCRMFLASILLTLLVEIPLRNVRKLNCQ
ncbi:PREDICTED: uncharacterized protein LOC108567335 [Nicrophorus vespilloides]|uniref:Uncharacterized protein LOC108567335 n=1 Tax=Nicrophorus vespilloides TaxID=110193 RepID=A0ABM1N8S6_NICVS|nr:PREDICTED: uncharacterized protein LOC108567335 [Nicrophorus vespilloides]